MKFRLIDSVVERSADRIVAVKAVSLSEEYLQDHFPSFPVLPGVLMIEALVQAARELLAERAGTARLVLGEVRALRYGRFVRPGELLRVEVSLVRTGEDGSFVCKGQGTVLAPTVTNSGSGGSGMEGASAVSGRFVMRRIRLVHDLR